MDLRHERQLQVKAGEVAGCSVDVVVTGVPEWAVRTTKVPCSVEARIAGYAVDHVRQCGRILEHVSQQNEVPR